MVKMCLILFLSFLFVSSKSTGERIIPYPDLIPRPTTHSEHLLSDSFNELISVFRPETFFNRKSLQIDENTQCGRDVKILLTAASNRELWALKVFDSWAKPLPSGLLNGNIYWVGNYDECRNPLYQEQNRSFVKQPIETQYCSFQSNPGEPVEVRTGLILGICVPSVCNRTSIVNIIKNLSNIQNITENNLRCSNDRKNEKNTHLKGTIAFLVVLSILFLIVAIGTIIDLTKVSFDRKETNECLSDKNRLKSFLVQFSAIRTVRNILMMEKKENENRFDCLNGIRVLSLFWVILGHSFSSGIYYAANILDMQSARRNIFIHLITGGGFAVDTFFVLSSFLTTIIFVRQVEKKTFSIQMMIYYYVHRYVRLTPTFILTMFVSVYLTPYFGRGPMFPIVQGIEPTKCREGNWWSAFFYIGNFLKSDDLCLGITWYLYNDMQFYWIAPLTLIPFVKGKQFVAYSISIVFILIHIGSVLGLLVHYPSLVSNAAGLATNQTGPVFFDRIYMAPWCRIGPYAIGIILGFIVITTNGKIYLNRTVDIAGTILSILFGFFCLFSNYIDFHNPSEQTHGFTIAYQSLSRPMWSISVSWLIFLCCRNKNSLVSRMLSSAIWFPLARLNYAAYLVHIIVILITVLNQSNPLFYQFITCLNSFVSQLIFSYLAAMVIVIFFETPFSIIEKQILKQ